MALPAARRATPGRYALEPVRPMATMPGWPATSSPTSLGSPRIRLSVAVGYVGVEEAAHDVMRGDRGPLRRLPHHGVAGGQSRRQVLAGDRDREVPGREDPVDPAGLADGHDPLGRIRGRDHARFEPLDPLGGITKHLGGRLHLGQRLKPGRACPVRGRGRGRSPPCVARAGRPPDGRCSLAVERRQLQPVGDCAPQAASTARPTSLRVPWPTLATISPVAGERSSTGSGSPSTQLAIR